MAEHVLVPVDGSEQSRKAFEWTVDEYEGEDARITVFNVVDLSDPEYFEKAVEMSGEDVGEERYEGVLSETKNFLRRFVNEAEEAGIEASSDYAKGDSPSRGIVEYADEHDVDHVVVGSHGRSGVTRVLLGSVAENVTRRSPVPVTVVR
ncbi:MAG: nucleotide-binding universal stress UspA family protein [Methanobacteriota archaeon]|jgi:nucleotide-binding universal stress UspA family protein|uniref:Universal stress protein n=1 Tax=Halorutilus salinus TaxID=2487751 RepID=A0A9Q4GGN5_9EURY|nr:universal stress protein [Halorutilus salinus]MCX2818872.1 universal stress protein [Halorutilus salinus]